MTALAIALGLVAAIVLCLLLEVRLTLKARGPVYIHARCRDASCAICRHWERGRES